MEKSNNILFFILLLLLLVGSLNIVSADNMNDSALDDSSLSSLEDGNHSITNDLISNRKYHDFRDLNSSSKVNTNKKNEYIVQYSNDSDSFVSDSMDNLSHLKSKVSSSLLSSPSRESLIEGDDFVKYYKNYTQLVAYLKDANYLSPLANKDVTVSILGNTYLASSDEYGIIVFDINLVPGKYEAIVNFAGDYDYSSSSKAINFEVLTMPTNLTAYNIIMYYGDGSSLVAYLDDGNGYPLANKTVDISLKGRTYSRITDEEGKVTLPISLSSGRYNATVRFSEDYYYSSRKTVRIAVLDKPTSIVANNLSKDYGSSTNFIAYLRDINLNPLANKTIMLRINSTKNEVYNLTTDSKGKIVFELPYAPGTYRIDLSFSEKYHLNSSASSYVTINELDPFAIHVSVDGSDILGDGSLSHPFNTLSKAISEVNNGSIIYIHNGTYSGEGNTNINLDKSVTISSIFGDVVLDASSSGRILNISEGLDINIRGINFTNGNLLDYKLNGISDDTSEEDDSNGTYVINLDAYDSFGAVIFSRSNLNISHCSFTNNTALSGGAIYTNSKLLLDNCYFEGNRVNQSGGAVFNLGPDSTFVDCQFVDNKAVARETAVSGGAVYNNGSNLHIFNCVFDSNYLKELSKKVNGLVTGGAISNYAEGFFIDSSDFFSNFAEVRDNAVGPLNNSYGGAIYTYTVDACVISNNRFINDSSQENNFENIVMLGSSCFGGAIACTPAGSGLYLLNNTFINCSSSCGAVYTVSDDSVFENNTFDANVGKYQASAIYDKGNRGYYKGNNFSSYTSLDTAGTLVSIRSSDVTLENNTFKGVKENAKYTGQYGQALSIYAEGFHYSLKNNINIINNVFEDNVFGMDLYGATSANIINNTFKNHESSAIYSFGGTRNSNWNIIGNYFENNGYNSYWGATFVPDHSVVSNNSFVNNHGFNGGAIRQIGDYSVISNNRFINNTAMYNGGAIASGDWSYNTLIDNNYFQDNAAPNGSAMYFSNSNGTVSNNVFNNTVGSENIIAQNGDWVFYQNNTIYEHQDDVYEDLDYYINNHKRTPNDFNIVKDKYDSNIDIKYDETKKIPKVNRDIKYNDGSGYYDDSSFDKALEEFEKLANEIIQNMTRTNSTNSTVPGGDDSSSNGSATNVSGGNSTVPDSDSGSNGSATNVSGGNSTIPVVPDDGPVNNGSGGNSTVPVVPDNNATNNSSVVDSNVTNSTVPDNNATNNSSVVDSNVTNSTVPVNNGSSVVNGSVVDSNVTNSTVPVNNITNTTETLDNMTEVTNQSSSSYNQTNDDSRDVGTTSDDPASTDSISNNQDSSSSSEDNSQDSANPSELVEVSPSDTSNANPQSSEVYASSESQTSGVGLSSDIKPNAYEIEKNITEQPVTFKSTDYWIQFFIIIVFSLLLVYGYKREKNDI